ncbi:MAG: hypothetical protein ACR2NR_03105 [Solirubrobacteraceae bacterium]
MNVRRAPCRALALGLAAAAALAGCGFNVQSADLFLLTRTGQGPTLTLLVNDGGTIRCNGGKTRPLSDPLLIQARDLAVDLGKDASRKLSLPASPGTVFYYRIRVSQGSVAFPDRRAAGQKPLREAETFALAAAQQACGLSG